MLELRKQLQLFYGTWWIQDSNIEEANRLKAHTLDIDMIKKHFFGWDKLPTVSNPDTLTGRQNSILCESITVFIYFYLKHPEI